MLSRPSLPAEQDGLPLARTDNTPFHRRLRAATRACHDEVDGLFGAFDLADRSAYAAFLAAHAHALLPLETWLDPESLSPRLGRRGAALAQDLADLGMPAAAGPALDWPHGDARRWGAAYVIEGSRLGGALLKRAVPEDFPRRYLGAGHGPGAWRDLLGDLDARAASGGPGWEAEAADAARRSFALFAQAAAMTGSGGAT